MNFMQLCFIVELESLKYNINVSLSQSLHSYNNNNNKINNNCMLNQSMKYWLIPLLILHILVFFCIVQQYFLYTC